MVVRKALTLFAVLWVALVMTAAGDMALAQAPTSPRDVADLSTGWRFRFGDAPEAVREAEFDDSGWEQVSVPHTWNRIGEYALERSAATDNRQGVGWYRLTFNAPAAAKGRRQYLDFGAVAIIADVWANGVHVGQHKGAYSRFRFDVTAAWKPGAANVIVVRADNSKPAVGSSTEHVLPLSGDFFQHGGMYRGVSLITANDVGIDLLDFGGPGVYVQAEEGLWVSHVPNSYSGPIGSVDVKVRLRNWSTQTQKFKIRATLLDSKDRQLADGFIKQEEAPMPVGTSETGWRTSFNLSEFRLWDGRADPWLYKIKVDVIDGKTVLDSVTQSFGIRSFKFDPNSGFSLNGKPLKLHGVSRHQDRLGKGYALSREDHAEDMAIIKEMDANSVRQAHYQHADEWSDEADKAGMIVWAEVPYVTTPSLSGGEGSAEVFANAEQQMRELIRQNYNHPSIMMWSIGNEVDASALFGLGGGSTKPLKLLQHIAKIAKEEDPTRPTIFADCCEDVRSPVAGLDAQVQGEKLAGAADMISYNRYYGWYYPEPLKAREQLAAQMDKFHVKHPTLPIAISEYGAGGAIGQHSDNPAAGYVNATGRPQPEEYESWVHEQSWPVIRDRPYIFGSYVWNMFDFASDLRNEGDSVDINTKGLVTMDRKTRKDAFYYYKAQWTNDEFIHLTGKRYTDRAYPVMDVRAYTNLPKAFLQVNGCALVETACPEGICIWRDVALKPGANQVMVAAPTNDRGMPVQLSDTATFNGPDPAKDGIHLDAGDISGHVQKGAVQTNLCGILDCYALAETSKRRFGSDNFVTGGTPAVLNQGGFGGRGAPKKTVTAPNLALYDYYREGEAFSYAIPVPDGKWVVTIHSFEPRADGAGLMTIFANGKVAVPAFNVRTEAGGSLKGLTKSFSVTVRGGVLRLDFTGKGGKAVVAAIEIMR
jgi:beta-galactosidase